MESRSKASARMNTMKEGKVISAVSATTENSIGAFQCLKAQRQKMRVRASATAFWKSAFRRSSTRSEKRASLKYAAKVTRKPGAKLLDGGAVRTPLACSFHYQARHRRAYLISERRRHNECNAAKS